VVLRAALALALLTGAARAAPTPGTPPPPAPAPARQPSPPPLPAPSPAPSPAPAPAPDPVIDVEAEPVQPSGFPVAKPPADMIRDNSLLLTHARTARDAARAGRCEVTLELSPKVRELDPTFHDQLFVTDPLIAECIHPRPRARYVLREVRAEPPASAGRLSGELLLGMVVGTGGALIGALLGNGLCIGGGENNDCDASLIGGAYVGAVATIPIGVRAVGTSGDQTGSLGMTYLGSLLGGLGGLLMLANGRENITALGLIFAPPLGAVIGFNATRRYRPRHVRVIGALVEWSDGAGASLGVPVPTRARSADRTVTTVPLLGGTF